LLREYEHGIEDLEITTALFVSDERRGYDKIIASGWNSQIFIWEDEDDDEVEEYKTLTGHKEDVLHIAGLNPLLTPILHNLFSITCSYNSSILASVEHDLLATGDYEGKIFVWKLSTGAKKIALYHRAERYETSIDQLLWLPTIDQTGDQILLLLSAGGDGIIRVWLISSSQPRLLVTLEGAHGRLGEVCILRFVF